MEDGILYAATGRDSSNSPNSAVTDFAKGTGNGLEIYDVSDPNNPVHLSTSKTLGRMSYSNYDYFYVALGDGGIAVLDHDLNQLATYSTQNAVRDLKIAGEYLFTAEGERGIGIWSLDGTSLKRVSSYCPTVNRYFSCIAVIISFSPRPAEVKDIS